ncbi:hypothetical protein MC7420_6856 [Coleofasciculus chthonoplastes PCC 7420]|uniref:Uncharacterized protein n=1 Tax=Coleofasciculus chthonoplastes PCC 7420 TaxID=118168 RepID=B4VWQ8_9CYAN|nr:hypothetical protein MC7420_6856 [Coleofasciculus chthonoplastes PCC 7420]
MFILGFISDYLLSRLSLTDLNSFSYQMLFYQAIFKARPEPLSIFTCPNHR